MEDLIEFILFCCKLAFWVLIYDLTIAYIQSKVKTDDEPIEDVKDRLMKLIHFVKPEQHGEMTYWFDADTDAFLGQGITEEAIIAQVRDKFPTHIFITDNGETACRAPEWKKTPLGDLLSAESVKQIAKESKP
jgi:hypothetical protein